MFEGGYLCAITLKRATYICTLALSHMKNTKIIPTSMHMTQYRFLKQKDGAKNFLSRDEADTYMIKRKIRGAEAVREQ